jgi:putative transposase
MPSRAKRLDRAVARLPSIPKELVNQFLTGPMTGEAINAAGIAFKQALIEASLNAELSHHLGYPPGAERPEVATNQRNGFTSKTVLTGDGKVRIETPRDRDGSFEPVLLPKHARRFTAFDDSIVALYARGMTVREIQGYLAEAYGTEVGHDLISTVTDGVLAEVTAWQARPLEPVYPVVFFDALRVKIREDNVVRNKAVYLALGIRRDGSREILGLWIETTEGAKFWMKVFNDLKTRGVNDILIAVTDGLTGMPAALEAVFPRTTLHLAFRSVWLTPTKRRADLYCAFDP